MSQVAPHNAIKRFTYDWLIRFCELHPTSRYYSTEPNNYDFDVPLFSKYCQVSTLFTSLMQRYMPNIMRLTVEIVKKDEIICFEYPTGNKTTVLTGYVTFDCTVPETITKYNDEKIYFNMSTLSLHHCVIHPGEFKFLLKQCKNVNSDRTKFTKPVPYSEIWPLLRPYMEIYLNIENLVFDDKMPEVLKQFPQNTPKEWKIFNMSLRNNCVLPLVENFISSPVGSYLHMIFRPDDSDLSCESMVNVAEKKFLDAGYVVDKGPTPPDMTRTIVFEKVSNEICIYFGE